MLTFNIYKTRIIYRIFFKVEKTKTFLKAGQIQWDQEQEKITKKKIVIFGEPIIIFIH